MRTPYTEVQNKLRRVQTVAGLQMATTSNRDGTHSLYMKKDHKEVLLYSGMSTKELHLYLDGVIFSVMQRSRA